ncbi:serine hydrolase domain-containing protein [Paenibacillus odorifer]|uniref:serine hydrolase domain-containing protein n=1 Tax=Paenibacillus odorifer TaxID=189426 RepID=UPI00289D7A66|nr:serine hydrolase [Paenibacillus odorifer]
MDNPENLTQALSKFYEELERSDLPVNTFMLLRKGEVITEFYRQPYRKNVPQVLFSLSKSFTSIAAGIAWDNGYFDLTDKVVSFFPDQLPSSISPNLEKMTIHHLLSMNTGHNNNIYGAIAKQNDWVRAFLALDVEDEPGSYYNYNTHDTYMVSAIIEKTTGENLVDFLMPRLFTPLDIERPEWETCPLGIVAGGMGLSIPTDGIAKFGQMLLNQGVYNSRRIVSKDYLKLALNEQSDNRWGQNKADWSNGYGYQFFMCRNGCKMGNGAFGQLCFIDPSQEIVIAATSSFTEMKKLQDFLDIIYANLLNFDWPTVASNIIKPPTFTSLVDRIVKVDYRSYSGTYVFEDNKHKIKELTLKFEEEHLSFSLLYDDHLDEFPFDFSRTTHAKSLFIKDLSLSEQEVCTSASWQYDDSKLILTVYYIETPYVVDYTLSFSGKKIELYMHRNLSLEVREDITVIGWEG